MTPDGERTPDKRSVNNYIGYAISVKEPFEQGYVTDKRNIATSVIAMRQTSPHATVMVAVDDTF